MSSEVARVDAWVWSVRLTKTRSQAAQACRAGHVQVNGERAKPATPVREGDQVRVRIRGVERVVEVRMTVSKRVGPTVAAEAYLDHTPAPPTREASAPPLAQRERGAGRPTKKERRELDRLRGRG